MKPHKLFLTSLLAAAAMSASAYAWTIGADGLPVITDFSPKESQSDALTISKNTTYKPASGSTTTFTIGNNDLVLQATSNASRGGEFSLNSISGGTGGVWFKSGSWKLGSATIGATGDLYLQGGQFWVSAEKTISNNVFLGDSTFDAPENELENSALRIGATANLTGTTTILSEGTNIAFQGGALNITKLSGSGNITTSQWSGDTATRVITVASAEDFTGTISLADRIQLNWSSSTATFGGLRGSGSVAGGSYLNIANAKDGPTFTGTVGAVDNGVALALTGSGTQSFTGTSYFSTVSVADTAALTLGGNVTLGSAIDNAGSVTFSSGAVVEIGALGTLSFDTTQNGKIDFSDSQFTIATGTGTVSGLTAGSIRVNGVESFSVTVASDCKSVSVSGSAYNIASGSTATISDVTTAGTVDFINVLGTLTGFGETAVSLPISGSGTVEFSSLSSKTITLSNWTGTVAFKSISDVNNVGLTLSDYGSKIRFDGLEGRVTASQSSGLWFNSGTVNADIEIASGGLKVTNGTSSATTTFAGKLTGAGTFEYTRAVGQTFKFTGNFSEFTGTLKGGSDSTGIFELANDVARTYQGRFDNAIVKKSGTGTLTITGGGSVSSLTISGGSVEVTGSGVLTGTLSSLAAGASLKLAGTGATKSAVTISGAVAAGTDIEVSNGNSVTYTGTSLAGNVTISGTGSTFTQSGDPKSDQLAASGSADGGTIQNTITVENGGTLDLADNRWTVKNGNAIVLDGGTIKGTGQQTTTSGKYYGVLDFCGQNGNGEGGAINTVVVKNTFEKESFITGPVRLRNVGANFDIQGTAVLNITGRLANSGTLQKRGSGTLVLDLADDAVAVAAGEDFSGAVNINEGKVVVKNSAVFGKTTAATTRAITVAGNAALQINLAGGAFDVGTTGVTFASGSKFLIDLTGVSVEENTALTIISSSAISFNSTPTGSLTSEIIESYFDAGNSVLGDYSTWLRDWSYDTTNGLQLTMTIPEPSVFGLLAGLGALALAGTRRRRRKA